MIVIITDKITTIFILLAVDIDPSDVTTIC